jgi:hypothetical protein
MPNTTNFNWATPADTDLVKDGAAAIRTLGSSIDTSFVDLKGGTSGQVLSKNSNTDLDFTWVAQDDSNAIQNAIVDAKGDIITATAADTPARLAVGTNNQILVADSSTATGLKWATPAGGGKVLQVVSATTTTSTNILSTSLTDTGITATITPTSASSKILVIVSAMYLAQINAGQFRNGAALLRASTTILNYGTSSFSQHQSATFVSQVNHAVTSSVSYLDSPATTSATTYKLQARLETTGSSSQMTFQIDSSPSTITLLEIGA